MVYCSPLNNHHVFLLYCLLKNLFTIKRKVNNMASIGDRMLVKNITSQPFIKNTVLSMGLLAAALSPLSVTYAAQLPGKGVNVQPIESTLSEETFQTLLVSKALAELGYNVKPPQEVDYNVAYLSVAAGDATFLAVNWDQLHAEMYQGAGGDAKFYREGNYVAGAVQGYLIDKKTAEQYHITSLEQLKDPNIAKLFDSSGNGKADLTGCAPGWGCEATINHQLQAFGLSQTVEHNQGNYNAIIADTIMRYKEGRPILYYTWTPYWVSDVLKPGRDVVWLQVPFSALPGENSHVDTELANGRNYGFPANTMKIVANKQFAQDNPAAAKLFEVMQLPISDVNAQNLRMRQGEDSIEDIERHVDGWIMVHRATFDGWLESARQADNH